MPAISVLLPTYNNGEFLPEAIDSILKQTFSDFELLIWDDGSTDLTREICEKFAELDPRVQYFYGENKGVARSLNRLIDKMSGKYVARMDGDDICNHKRFEIQLGYFKDNPYLNVLGSKVELFGNQRGVWHYRNTPEQTTSLALLGNTPLCHPSWMVDARLYHEFHYDPNFEYLEDYEWLCRVMVEADLHMYCSEEILMKYRQHADNVSIKKKALQQAMRREVLERLWLRLKIKFKQSDLDIFCDDLIYGQLNRDWHIVSESCNRLGAQLSKHCEKVSEELSHKMKRINEAVGRG